MTSSNGSWPRTVVTSHLKQFKPKLPEISKEFKTKRARMEGTRLSASLEALNSSIALSIGTQWLYKVRAATVALQFVNF